ncbi:MAG TPA: RNA polymerase sigma factor [Thermoanaerobaculia bacterium]|jgi:RNA polymerase sigma-70 factor (ECF subfamily)|nr:RNA polymerase sigma factor [Thermoanaerobaculia bacterium]
MKHLSDQDLMRIVQAGDYSPASEIYDRYSGRIYNFAFRFLKNAEAAEDATQEVFVKMLRHANQFHGDAKLSTWLFSITANWCRDYLRKADNKSKESDDVLVTLPASSEHSPDRTLERRENEQRVRRALATLTAEQREAILLSRYQGLSYAEIAQIAGCSEGAVKTRVFRAMETLKKTLAGEVRGGERCLNVVQ